MLHDLFQIFSTQICSCTGSSLVQVWYDPSLIHVWSGEGLIWSRSGLVQVWSDPGLIKSGSGLIQVWSGPGLVCSFTDLVSSWSGLTNIKPPKIKFTNLHYGSKMSLTCFKFVTIILYYGAYECGAASLTFHYPLCHIHHYFLNIFLISSLSILDPP